ncbi:hypothetical protein GCM10011335_35080 [Aureimonas glaciei]|uniref:Uncharacterized protein n=2 Tax=Aureimonas glaciei TaxID=1776957 RepID=A0A916Y3G1_9HYPH|nr:hypothetical protein [Aureimonas glaciei]GGD28888.1 hypothetical protein GCM10011335_35080 [Aureimonas glaciei]
MSVADHIRLLEVLRSLVGYVVLSGYDCPLYDDALKGRTRLDRVSIDNGGNRRVESIWLNPAATEASMSPDIRQYELFGAT